MYVCDIDTTVWAIKVSLLVVFLPCRRAPATHDHAAPLALRLDMHLLRHLDVEAVDDEVVVVLQHERHVLELDAGRLSVRREADRVLRRRVHERVENLAKHLLVSSQSWPKQLTSSIPSSSWRCGAVSFMYSLSFLLRLGPSGSGGMTFGGLGCRTGAGGGGAGAGWAVGVGGAEVAGDAWPEAGCAARAAFACDRRW